MSVPETIARGLEDASSLDPITRCVRREGEALLVEPPALDHLLGGGWLGHRLHPALAQVPMGAFVMATLLSVTGSRRYDDAVDALLLTGVVSAIPTAVSGAQDLATTGDRQSGVGLVHAVSMDTALVLYAAALVNSRRGRRGRGAAYALAGALVAGGGAYLGGHLVYRLGVGVGA